MIRNPFSKVKVSGYNKLSGSLGASPQTFLLAFLLVEDPRNTVGELGPVGVQAAAPAGGEAGEEPGLLAVRPVAGTLLLPRSAVARHLQAHILHQVPAEGSPAGLLDVQKHDHVLPFDLEIDRPLQVPDGEVVFLNVVGVRSGEDVHLVLLREITMRGAEIDHPGSHVLIENQHKAHRSDDDQQEFAAPLDHGPSQCGSHSSLPFPSQADNGEHGARLLHVRSPPVKRDSVSALSRDSFRFGTTGEVAPWLWRSAQHPERRIVTRWTPPRSAADPPPSTLVSSQHNNRLTASQRSYVPRMQRETHLFNLSRSPSKTGEKSL